MNKRILIASIFATLMLLVPMTSVVGISEIKNDCGYDFNLKSKPDLLNYLSDLKTNDGPPILTCIILYMIWRSIVIQYQFLLGLIAFYHSLAEGSLLKTLLESFIDKWETRLFDLEEEYYDIGYYGDELGCWSFPSP